uniref:VWF/SSPO/Zonadhesin-like cysteine-rich domain-containing protein n=1 Tax=Eptatretus burgeri TaxID=7764 RepID=A0A8C4N7R0_EPTBU
MLSIIYFHFQERLWSMGISQCYRLLRQEWLSFLPHRTSSCCVLLACHFCGGHVSDWSSSASSQPTLTRSVASVEHSLHPWLMILPLQLEMWRTVWQPLWLVMPFHPVLLSCPVHSLLPMNLLTPVEPSHRAVLMLRQPVLCSTRHLSRHAICLLTGPRYHEACLTAVCSCPAGRGDTCLCDVMAAYAHQCAQARTPVTWRNSTLCPWGCPRGQEYSECAPSCGGTCGELRLGLDCPVDEGCVAGCVCPHGTLRDERGLCVPAELCPCLEGGIAHPPSHTVRRGCSVCTCKAAAWVCTDQLCPDVTHCPNNLQWQMRGCLVTCDSLDRPLICSEGRYQGCVCPNGTVLLDDSCVPPSECPCQHNGREYPCNSTIQKDCNTCTCTERRWEVLTPSLCWDLLSDG